MKFPMKIGIVASLFSVAGIIVVACRERPVTAVVEQAPIVISQSKSQTERSEGSCSMLPFEIIPLVAAYIIGEMYIETLCDNRPVTPTPSVCAKQRYQIEPHLKLACDQTSELLVQSEKTVQGRLAQIRTGGRPQEFAKTILTLSRKFNYATQNKAEFRTEIAKQFESHVLSSDELQNVINSALKDFLKQLEHIDNELLVAVKTDVPGFDTSIRFSTPAETIQQDFANLIKSAQKDIAAELESAIAQDICSLVVTEVISSSVTSGLRKEGVLGDDAGSTAAALFISLLTDQIVGAVANEIYSPEKELTAKLEASLIKAERSTASKFGELIKSISIRRDAERKEIVSQVLGEKK